MKKLNQLQNCFIFFLLVHKIEKRQPQIQAAIGFQRILGGVLTIKFGILFNTTCSNSVCFQEAYSKYNQLHSGTDSSDLLNCLNIVQLNSRENQGISKIKMMSLMTAISRIRTESCEQDQLNTVFTFVTCVFMIL